MSNHSLRSTAHFTKIPISGQSRDITLVINYSGLQEVENNSLLLSMDREQYTDDSEKCLPSYWLTRQRLGQRLSDDAGHQITPQSKPTLHIETKRNPSPNTLTLSTIFISNSVKIHHVIYDSNMLIIFIISLNSPDRAEASRRF